jgi:3-oxoadipate enol-lactonase
VADACNGRTTLLAALPGYGASPAWSGPASAVALAEAIEAAVLALGHTNVDIVGFSGGAHHALRLATRRILGVGTIIALGGVGDLSAEERAGIRQFAQTLRQAPLPPGFAAARFLSPSFAAEHPDAVRRVDAWAAATSAENLAAELEAFADAEPVLPDLASFCGRLVARTGSLDLAAPPSHAQAIARACPSGRLEIVEAAGHALLEEDCDGTLDSVKRALAET